MEQVIGGSVISVALLIFFVSPLPILSLSVVLLIAWQYVLVTYHRNIRGVSSEVDQLFYKAKVAVESSRRYASEIATQEQSILSLVVAICTDAGPYSLITGSRASKIAPLLNGNVTAVIPAAKELTALSSGSSITLRSVIQAYGQTRWLADKANLLAKHGEIVEALSVIQSMSTELTSALDGEAQLFSAKAKAHDLSTQVHLDDIVSSHKKVIDQLQAAAARPSRPDPQSSQGTLPNTVVSIRTFFARYMNLTLPDAHKPKSYCRQSLRCTRRHRRQSLYIEPALPNQHLRPFQLSPISQ